MSPSDPLPLEVSIDAAQELLDQGVPLFDIRGTTDQAAGMAGGAVSLDAESTDIPPGLAGMEPDSQFLVCCAGGVRSLATVRRFRELGLNGATSLEGGFKAWKEQNLPVDFPPGSNPAWSERYARHLVLRGVGTAGQLALGEASILLVGAGGLGSPAALYLAAAGIGRLGLVDDDLVERSNLQRQVLHSDDAIGTAKTDSARQRIEALNPDVEVVTMPVRLVADNVESLLEGWDLVIDGSDNPATRYVVNRACVGQGIPLVYGAVTEFEGQASVFCPHLRPGIYPCYECLFPESGSDLTAPDCNTAGVLGVVPGLIGMIQATEAMKLVMGSGETLLGRMLLWDALGMQFRELKVKARADCEVCGAVSGPGALIQPEDPG